jgi:hypothetical protein
MDLTDALKAIDDATTKLGTNMTTLSTAVAGVSSRVDALKGSIGEGMTAEQVQAAHSALDAEAAKLDTVATALDTTATTLNGIAADPATPVPTPVPPPPVI